MALLLLSCARPAKPVFDGNRAFVFLERQVALGPRNAGSPGWQAFQTLVKGLCDSLGVACRAQAFVYNDYLTGANVPMTNWIATINPKAGTRILVAAHYDCRPRADREWDTSLQGNPIPGANDGASGVAVLMHLMELMQANPPGIGVDLVFFDGEDYGLSGRADQYSLGSSYFAMHLDRKYKFGLLLDMIGDRDLKIYREEGSELHAKAIVDKVWQAAARRGARAFVDTVGSLVIDDHLPLLAAGIPTVDIIDFDYPSWHTLQDTPDKCSAASLETVGQVIVDVIYEE